LQAGGHRFDPGTLHLRKALVTGAFSFSERDGVLNGSGVLVRESCESSREVASPGLSAGSVGRQQFELDADQVLDTAREEVAVAGFNHLWRVAASHDPALVRDEDGGLMLRREDARPADRGRYELLP
jgi:hypothetical protein